MRSLSGSFVRKVLQSDDFTFVLQIGKDGVLVSCDPAFFRASVVSSFEKGQELSSFGKVLKAHIEGAKLIGVEQLDFDRAILFRFASSGKQIALRAELVGTRSNFYLSVDGRPAGKCRQISAVLSSTAQRAATDLSYMLAHGSRVSAFLRREIDLLGAEEVARRAETGPPGYSRSEGVFPYPPEQWKGTEFIKTKTLSEAIECYISQSQPAARARQKRATLLGKLQRALNARRSAMRQISDVLDTAARAKDLQMRGEILLANATSFPIASKALQTLDYDGNAIEIRVDPKKTAVENAEAYFSRARKAKSAAEQLQKKAGSLGPQIEELQNLLDSLETDPSEVQDVEDRAKRGGFLRDADLRATKLEERPYGGLRIREAAAPGGFKVLWAENAAANDYLTTRIAKPNDYWFHVRGASGAHVVLQTMNKPERVQQEALLFAAQIAARNSGQKHSGSIPVSYTLAKYVRKPRKAAPGTVTIENDKTLFVAGLP